MGSPRLWRDKRFIVSSYLRGVVILGIAVAAWALVNIMASPSRTGVSKPYMSPTATSSTPTKSADATSASLPDQADYPTDPNAGEVLGTLMIPATGESFPVVEGTGVKELKIGVGHLVQTAMPGEPDNCVISGHRDTVFSRLGELKIGDVFVIETATGTYSYEIGRIRIVDKDDRTVVVPTDHAVLTVSTCYPFQYVGSAPDRYVLIADLVTGQ